MLKAIVVATLMFNAPHLFGAAEAQAPIAVEDESTVSKEGFKEARTMASAQNLVAKAYRAMLSKKDPWALAAFKRALELDPDCFGALVGLGDALKKDNEKPAYFSGNPATKLAREKEIERNKLKIEELDQRATTLNPAAAKAALEARASTDPAPLVASQELRILAAKKCVVALKRFKTGDFTGSHALLEQAKDLDANYPDVQRINAKMKELLADREDEIENWKSVAGAKAKEDEEN